VPDVQGIVSAVLVAVPLVLLALLALAAWGITRRIRRRRAAPGTQPR